MQTKLYDIKEWCQHGYELENYIGTTRKPTRLKSAQIIYRPLLISITTQPVFVCQPLVQNRRIKNTKII